jgi:formylmethanofuran dehydrogenase subunit E
MNRKQRVKTFLNVKKIIFQSYINNFKTSKKGDNMSEYMDLLEKAGDFHGDICGGIVMGTKLAIFGMGTLGMTPGQKDKRLIVFTEIDRCISDAISSVTKTSLGKKSLKPVGYGKFAATFVNIETGEAYRIVDIGANKKDKDKELDEETIEELTKRIDTYSWRRSIQSSKSNS